MSVEEKTVNILNADVNEENIQDAIRNANVVTDEIATEAAKQIADRRKEQLTKELINVVQKCEYTVKSTVLQVRRSNRVNRLIKEYLKNISALAEDIKSGKKPVTDWNDEAAKLKKELDKELIKVGDEIDKSQSELDSLFPSCWSFQYNKFIPNRKDCR